MNTDAQRPPAGRVLALDYGSVHTGAAMSDPTGTIVRPLPEITGAATPPGLEAVAALVTSEGASLVLVGMPVSLSGEMGAQADETSLFVAALKQKLEIPVLAWDERFTSSIASARGRFSSASSHSLAACVLLEDFLSSEEYRKMI